MPTRGSSRFIAPSIHSLYKPPFLTQLHYHTFTTSLLVTMPGWQNRRGGRNARCLDFPPDFVPKGWFIINEINKDGVEEALQPGRPLIYCIHCRSMGHEAHRCGFSEEYVRAINALYPIPAAGPALAPVGGGEPTRLQRATYQCGLCHRYGHNARTCRVLL